jgi:hypothetical protein
MSPEAFLASGMIPDPLSAEIQKAINSKSGLRPQALKGIMDDGEKLASAMELFDRVLTFCVVEPEVEMPPPCTRVRGDGGEPCGEYAQVAVLVKHDAPNFHKYQEGVRDEDTLYADQVEWADKSFIFQWALGGTSDLIQFREEQQRSMDAVSDSQGVRKPTKRAARSR